MTSVFISHSSLDDALVRACVVEPLEQHGITVWYSRDAIQGADEWEKRIRHALVSMEWFLVALSRRSVQSEWVRAEVDWALEHRRGKVVPVLLDECDPQECHLRLRQIQYIDLRNRNPAGQRQLVRVWEHASTPITSDVDPYRPPGSASPRGHNASPPSSVVPDEDYSDEYAPFKKGELLQIRRKLVETVLDLKMTVLEYTEATMPLQRRIEIRALQKKIELIDSELARRT